MKKGFTLVELLAVIVILALILAVAVPAISGLINNSSIQAYQANEKLLVKAAKTYLGSSNSLSGIANGEIISINLSELQSNNYIGEIKDVKNSAANCTGKVFIKNNEGVYEFYPSLTCGSNYQTINDIALKYDAISSISHVYNAGSNNYTITINLNRKGNARTLITPTSTISIYKPTILDYNTWVLGSTGSQGVFGRNGTAAENQIVLKQNPWGVEDTTWATLSNDTNSDSDGGWDVSNLSIDRTKKYRFTVWIRREDAGDGRTYFGTQGGTVANLGTETTNTNPYFRNNLLPELPSMANNWLLWVGYVFPAGYAGSADTNSGVYSLNGTKLISNTDYKWTQTATVGGHRTYLYYSTAINEKQWWYRPRMEIVDGSEPSISELLNGYENGNIYNANVNATGTVTYTVVNKGTYNFSILINDSIYKFSYSIN